MIPLNRQLLLLMGIFLLLACGQKQASAPSKEDFVGNWKVQNPQLGSYYMTLNPDGSGSSTREGGEMGKWQFNSDHIELEWNPKNITLYFNPGKTTPRKQPSLQADAPSTAEK